jgi:hypothetical protein
MFSESFPLQYIKIIGQERAPKMGKYMVCATNGNYDYLGE